MKKTFIILLLLASYISTAQTKEFIEAEKEAYKALKKDYYPKFVYDYFDKYFPEGKHVKNVQKKADDIAYKYAIEQDSYILLKKYKKYFPKGKHVAIIDDKLDEIATHHLNNVIDRKSIGKINLFIKEHPGANKQIEEAKMRKKFLHVMNTSSLEDKYNFLEKQPDYRFNNEIIDRIWEVVEYKNSIEKYKEFISRMSNKHYSSLAQDKISKLEFKAIKKINTIPEYEKFIAEHPQHPYKNEVKKILNELIEKDKQAFSKAKSQNTIPAYNEYLHKQPYGKYRNEALRREKQLPTVSNIRALANGSKINIYFRVNFRYYTESASFVSITNNKNIRMEHIEMENSEFKTPGTYRITWNVLEDTEALEGKIKFYIDVSELYNEAITHHESFSRQEMYIAKEPFTGQTVWVNGGTFQMGRDEGYDVKPIHSVTVSSFRISKYEITNQQYADFMNAIGANSDGTYNGTELLDINGYYSKIKYTAGRFVPQKGKENYPVVYVSWYGAKAYAEHYGGRLPTEAEWEFAASGGNSSKGYIYSGSNSIDDVAWRGSIHTVGTKKANELGIYDMSGNVHEWCNDWHFDEYYKSGESNNPQGPSMGISRVVRGGSWSSTPYGCLVTNRYSHYPYTVDSGLGFRPVFAP